jgi:hypothetical protein
VKEVVLDYGTKILDFEALKEATMKHFHSLFTHQSKANPKNEVDLIEHIPTMITNEENSELTRPIEEDEIKNVIWSLEPNKAPGLDGFSISFYRYFWELIKFDMKRMLQYTQRSCKLGGSMNTSFLALIPKETNPSSFTRFQPKLSVILHIKL